jgi:dTDP-4-amino-4,6-dideoxygalactose transaminase
LNIIKNINPTTGNPLEIKFFDMIRQYKSIEDEVNDAISSVLNGGKYVLAENVEAFEREFAQYLGVKYAVGVASGTEAIQLALMALGIGRGDEVITVSNTAVPTVSAVSLAGATPVLCDIDPSTLTIDIEKVKDRINKNTRAILPVHLYGMPVDMNRLSVIAEKMSIPLIEDACQAHGASIHDKKVGGFVALGCFSFYPTKNLGCYGDGGAVVTNDGELYDKLKLLRNYGQRDRYIHEVKGLNSRLDELQAAILMVKLKKLDGWNLQRIKLAGCYNELILNKDVIKLPRVDGFTNVYHLYVIRHPRRDKLMQYLAQNGVQTLIHYPIPIHLQRSYAELGSKGDFPVSEKACNEVLSLSLYPELKEAELEYISDLINKF